MSISTNIAEGSSRKSGKEQAQFYEIAYSSALEVLNQLILSVELEFMKESVYEQIREELEQITGMLSRLHKAAKKR